MSIRALARTAVTGLLVAWIVATLAPLVAIGVGTVTGREVTVVTTGSMRPAVPPNALTMIEPVETADLRPGDVISYRRPENRSQVVLHRVVEVIERGDDRFFRTKGDANVAEDARPVPDDDVQGRLTNALPHIGIVLVLATRPAGTGVLVGVPLLLAGLERVLAGAHRPRDGSPVPWTARTPPQGTRA